MEVNFADCTNNACFEAKELELQTELDSLRSRLEVTKQQVGIAPPEASPLPTPAEPLASAPITAAPIATVPPTAVVPTPAEAPLVATAPPAAVLPADPAPPPSEFTLPEMPDLSLDLSLPDLSLPDLSLVESALSSLSATEVSLLLFSFPLLLIAGGLWKPVPEAVPEPWQTEAGQADAGQPPPGEGLLSGFLDAGRTGGYTADYGQPRVRSGPAATAVPSAAPAAASAPFSAVPAATPAAGPGAGAAESRPRRSAAEAFWAGLSNLADDPEPARPPAGLAKALFEGLADTLADKPPAPPAAPQPGGVHREPMAPYSDLPTAATRDAAPPAATPPLAPRAAPEGGTQPAAQPQAGEEAMARYSVALRSVARAQAGIDASQARSPP